MGGDDAALLGELLCARLCHDLAGAIGAIGTGVEILTDEDGGKEFAADALVLLEGSAVAAVNRLKFLRVALGNGGTTMSTEQLRQLVADFLGAQMEERNALRLEWRDVRKSDWGGDELKLLLNLVLLARDCLPRGGVVSVDAPAQEGVLPVVAAQGAQVAVAEAVKALDAADVSLLRPRGAQGYYASLLARRMGLSISCEDSHDRVVFATTKN